MTILKLGPEFKSNTSLELSPKRLYSSSSSGVSGSINVIVNRSGYQKDSIDFREGLTNTTGPQKFSENSFEYRRQNIYTGKFNTLGQGSIFGENPSSFDYELQLALLLDGAKIGESEINWPPELFKSKYQQLNLNFAEIGYSDLPIHPRNSYVLSCSRNIPGTDFTSKDYRKKEVIRNILDKGYITGYSNYGWGYGNFNCLNFYKTNSNNIPAVVYNSISDRYLPTSSLNIDFRIKLNNYPEEIGTILHLPGAFAVSVVTSSDTILGETIDQYSRTNKYRIVLQLGTDSSGSVDPRDIDLTVSNASRGSTQIYQSLDNITASMWHDCTIRISETQNNLTGTFIIDGNKSGTFNPTGSFNLINSLSQSANILSVGAFYTGTLNNSNLFFANQSRASQGVEGTTSNVSHPDQNTFICALDAELFEVKISDEYRSLSNIKKNIDTTTTSSTVLFYLPVLYSSNSPVNKYLAMVGDLTNETNSSTNSETLEEFFNTTPLLVSSSFDSPYNTNHSNIGGFLNLNSQSFLRDFITGRYPYLNYMSSSINNYDSQHILSSSWSFYDNHQRRNTLIVPCDDGKFKRDFSIYESSQLTGSVVASDNPKVIKLSNLGDFSSNYDSKLLLVDEGWKYSTSENLEPASQYPTLSNMSTAVQSLPKASDNPSSIPDIKYFDPLSADIIGNSEKSSNMVVMFSIPSLFYGNKIRPKTFKANSKMYRGGGVASGSNFIKGDDYRNIINICDDGDGNIIRCDTSGSIASNPVGSIYYEDGIIVLKSPHLFNFGENNYNLEFEGVQNIHMLELMVPIEKNILNTSTNPNFKSLKPSNDLNEDSNSFIYLTALNFHDKDMNIVAKTKLARPIIKRTDDRYMVKVKFDF